MVGLKQPRTNAIGISDSYISNIESGRKQPTIETLDKILSVIGFGSVEVLVNNELKKRKL